MRGASRLCALLLGVAIVWLAGMLWGADIDVQNDDFQVPAGQHINNYSFKVGTIGRLLMAPGAQ